MGCDRMPLLVWQGLPALPLSIRQEFATSQVTPSLFCTVTAPLKEFSSSSLNKHWLQRVNPNPFGAHLELSRYLSHSGSDCSHPRAQLGELLDCTDGIPVLQPGFTQGWLKCSFCFAGTTSVEISQLPSSFL